VRYEAQVKQRQQKELAEALVAKVKHKLAETRVLQDILQQSVADVESMYCSQYLWGYLADPLSRNRFF
jgi:F-type H+-transporting ATPase subunit b